MREQALAFSPVPWTLCYAAAYMSLPASQYSVLDAERIERVDDNSFKCYAHRLSFMSFEVCPVLLVKVEEKPDGCCIRLLGCQVSARLLAVSLLPLPTAVHRCVRQAAA